MKRNRVAEIKMTPNEAEVMDLQVADIIRAWHHSNDGDDLRSLARSCYYQGLLDGSRPEVWVALQKMKAES